MHKMHKLLGLMGLCLVVAACGGDDDSSTSDARIPADASIDASQPDATVSDAGGAVLPNRPSPLPTGTPTLKAVSFNAGLITVVKGAAEREPLIVAGLKALDADVLCVQEIYSGYKEPPAFAAQLVDKYPHSFWSWTGQYPQRSGLLILSKHPLYQGRETYFTMGNGGPTVDRMAIGATVIPSSNAWYVNVLCTHQHAGLKSGDTDIRQSQGAELKTWAMAENYFSEQTLLMGDFNAGPGWAAAPACECGVMTTTCDNDCDTPDTVAYNAVKADWTDAFDGATFFTSGREQFLQLALVPGLFPDEPSQRIDHCFFRNMGAAQIIPADTKRVMDADQTISINGGSETLNYLSDHYGVQCAFGP
jgi:endonuclease/exonuclease/phosphatase family metal-dependent hydrolase